MLSYQIVCVFNFLPIVGLYSKACLKRPLKDIYNKGRGDKWALNAARK